MTARVEGEGVPAAVLPGVRGGGGLPEEVPAEVEGRVRSWVEARGTELERTGWFEGRGFAHVDVVVRWGHALSIAARPEMRAGRCMRIEVVAIRGGTGDATAEGIAGAIAARIDGALVAMAHPARSR